MKEEHSVSNNLAANLIALRSKKKYSRNQVAQLSGIPRSTLSNIESGSGNPSLSNLTRLASALQVSVEELLSRPRNEVEHLDASQVTLEQRASGRVRIYKLLPDKVRALDVDRIEIDAGTTMPGHPHLQGAKEYFTVLKGEVTVYVAGDKFVVKKGEVLAFPGDQPHSYRNTGTSVAQCLSIVIPF